jgi:hypothetical protein
MRKFRQKIEAIDEFILALEEMIDARDDMWEEEKYSNVKQLYEIEINRYIPAREKLRDALANFILETIQEEAED